MRRINYFYDALSQLLMNVPFLVLCLDAPILVMAATSPASDVTAFP